MKHLFIVLFGVTGMYSFNALTEPQIYCMGTEVLLTLKPGESNHMGFPQECLQANGDLLEIKESEKSLPIDKTSENGVLGDPIEVIGNDVESMDGYYGWDNGWENGILCTNPYSPKMPSCMTLLH